MELNLTLVVIAELGKRQKQSLEREPGADLLKKSNTTTPTPQDRVGWGWGLAERSRATF